ncbi:hypothetical protein FOA52_014269 [Chlamydomonas sp. UWO 241]|nr:hypothetical protein FOA52_014269 [Chlamydomonas sp. UWO 241]
MAEADFESFGYAAGPLGGEERGLEQALGAALTEVDALAVRNAVTHAAISNALEAGLQGVAMVYLERDEQPTTSVSALHHSWVAESEFSPCDMDAWLRAAIPEQAPSDFKKSFAMEQFLRARSSTVASSSSNERPGSASRNPSLHTPHAQSPRNVASPQRSPNKSSRTASVSNSGARPSSSDARLREELEIRKAQAAIARSLDAKDAEEKQKLASLKKSLQGRDYAYDHKGNVVVIAKEPFVPTVDHGPAYRMAPPEAAAVVGRKSPQKGAAGGKKAKGGGKERELTNDYREAVSSAQPDALDSVDPAVGVTLRGGSRSKSGPPPRRAVPTNPGAAVTMSKEDFRRYLANQEAKAREAAREGASGAAGAGAGARARALSRAASMAPARASLLAQSSAQSLARGGAPPPPPFGADRSLAESLGVYPAAYSESRGDLAVFDGMSDAGPGAALSGGTLRAAPAVPNGAAAAPAPDVNPMLVTATDWGAVKGVGGGGGRGAALPVIKPSAAQRAKEVGKLMPRDRLAQAQLLGTTGAR